MCSWKQTWEVWPALLVAGGSFAVFQFVFATIHAYAPSIVIYPMTDIGGGMFSLIVTAIFLKFWKPRKEWHFEKAPAANSPTPPPPHDPKNPHAAEAQALLGKSTPLVRRVELPLTAWNVTVAWFPFVLMSILLLLTGFVRQMEGSGPVRVGPLQTNYVVPMPALDRQSERDPILHPIKTENLAALTLAGSHPLGAAVNVQLAQQLQPKPEKADFNFAWLTAPGTAVFLSALLSMALLRMSRRQIGWVVKRTFIQMKIPIPTICFMLGLSYVTRYAGMDATLGYAFAGTGVLYPFFAPLLGWLGVFLTGTDAGSNALFGSLQKITATQIHNAGAFHGHLDLGQAQVLICTANSTGGVMGKMIDAQSIVVATAATNQLGKEADIFKAVLWHSIFLAVIVGLLTLLQAYVAPFTALVPHLPR